MSAEVATVSVLWKPLAWIFGGLLALIKGLLFYIWVSHTKELEKQDKKNSETQKEVATMKLDLNKNYYDKDEITRHIVEPIREDMRETNATLKLFTTHFGDMQQDIAILKHTLLSKELRKAHERQDKTGM